MSQTAIDTLVFGGTFDPIHHGHLIVARHVAETVRARRVLLVPAAANPLKGGAVATGPQRLEMCRLAVGDDPLFDVSDVEITRQPPSYTIDTIETLRRLGIENPGLLIGADSLAELPRWHHVEDLLAAVRLVVCPRPPQTAQAITDDLERLAGELPNSAAAIDSAVVPGPLIDISATEIRKRVHKGQSVRYLIPDAVLAFIEKTGLYSDRH